MGYDIITPVEINPAPKSKDADLEWWPLVRRDLDVIWKKRPVGIILLPGWKNSAGSRMEKLMISKKLCGKVRHYADIEKSQQKR